MSKAQQAAGTADVTFEVMAKQRFPGESTPNAIASWLATPEGIEAYSDYLAEKAEAGIR